MISRHDPWTANNEKLLDQVARLHIIAVTVT